MNSNNKVPNYVGVSQNGEADLSPKKMLELFTQATLDYSVSGDLPESVDIWLNINWYLIEINLFIK